MVLLVAGGALLLSGKASAEIRNDMNKNLILFNGNIITLDGENPKASAVVSQNGRIVYVGTDARALEHKKSGSEVVDLKGKTAVPGLVDAHAHMLGLGRILTGIDLRGAKSFDDVLAAVKNRQLGLEPKAWIIGRGWDQNRWGTKDFPVNTELNNISPNNPVILKRVDGHAVLVNKKALELAGIDKETKDPEGGRIVRFDSGEPTGVLIDNAVDLVEAKIPKMSRKEIKKAILKAQESCLALGLVGVHDAGVTEDVYNAYMELGREGALKMRVYAMVEGSSGFYKKAMRLGPQRGLFDDHFTMRAVKLYADGSLGSRGALLTEPYSDDPKNFGLPATSKKELEEATVTSLKRGFQVATHAIGDRANHDIIDVYEEAQKNLEPNDPRFRIEHVQVIQKNDIVRMKGLGIIASMQPTHCTSDMPWAEKRLGAQRIKWAYVWRDVLNSGVKLALGSDFPVESNDPLLGLYAAVTRGGFYPEQRLSAHEALEGFTSGPAYASFEEAERGEIRAGKSADLTVLSEDILNVKPAVLLKTKVIMTIIGGEIEYGIELKGDTHIYN